MMKRLLLCVPVLLCACTAPPAPTPEATAPSSAAAEPEQAPAAQPAPAERPMDEVPVQKTAASGDREYHFANGCVVLLEAKRAVVKEEGPQCESHHRDIALLYASGD
jgi:hypothetical protein